MRMRSSVSATALLLMLAAGGCSDAAEPHAPLPDTVPALDSWVQVDSSVLTLLRHHRDYIALPMAVTLQNRSANDLLVTKHCEPGRSGSVLPVLQKKVHGLWGDALEPTGRLECTRPIRVVTVKPDSLYRDSALLLLGGPSSSHRPRFASDEIQGTYRWLLPVREYDPAGNRLEPLPVERRASEAFEIRILPDSSQPPPDSIRITLEQSVVPVSVRRYEEPNGLIWGVRMPVVFGTFQNRTSDTAFVRVTCALMVQYPDIERWQDGRWVDMDFRFGGDLCYAQPFPVPPGHLFRAGFAGQGTVSGDDPFTGRFRFVWYIRERCGLHPDRCPLLPLEQRVSEEFTFRVEERR